MTVNTEAKGRLAMNEITVCKKVCNKVIIPPRPEVKTVESGWRTSINKERKTINPVRGIITRLAKTA